MRQPRQGGNINPYAIAGIGFGGLFGDGVTSHPSFTYSAGAGIKISIAPNSPELYFDVRYAAMVQSGRYDSYIPIRFGVRAYVYGRDKKEEF